MSDDLTTNYALAYGTIVGFGVRPALILIDFCQGYFDPDCDLYSAVEDVLASALRIHAAARWAGVPVILTNVVYHPSAIDGGRFFEKAAPLRYFLKGNPMGGWPEGLVPEADELVISKQYPSAFFGTSLASTLTAMGVDSVLLTGLTTSGCVRASCVDRSSADAKRVVKKDRDRVARRCGDVRPAQRQRMVDQAFGSRE